MHHIPDIVLYITFFISLYFEVFLLINFFEKRPSLRSTELRAVTALPSVTIVVPAFNEEKTVSKTVFSLLSLDYPKDKLKIIIVDDGSTDRTAEVIGRFRHNKRVEIVGKENGGKYTALNLAIARTTTELVGCLDADSFVPPDTLRKMLPYFENERTMAVTPAIKIHEPSGFIRNIQSNEYNLGIFVKKSFSFLRSITVTPGPFSIFRKSVFDTLGPFRAAHHTEDLEIAMRMQKHFYGIENAHEAIVYTVGPRTFKKLYVQRVRWISGFFGNALDYRSLFFNRAYGHLGLFVLPMTVVGVGTFLASVSVLGWHIFSAAARKLVELETIGFNWRWHFRFDWFFLNTESQVFLSAVLFFVTLFLIFFGRKISEKKAGLSIHTLYFPFVYGLLSIAWISKALYNTALSKEVSWR